MSTTIEAGMGWVLGELDGWSGERGVKREIDSGSFLHLGAQDDNAAVLVEADKGSTRVTVYPGMKPLSVETFGIVSNIPLIDSKKPQIMQFELKGVDAYIQVVQTGKVLRVKNEGR